MNAAKASRPRTRTWIEKRVLLPWLALAIGAAASLVLFFFIRDNIEKEAKLRFERQASDAKHSIEARTISYLNVLYGLAALFSKPDDLTRAEFHNYVEALDVPHRYPGIWGLNFAEYVPREAKARYEARVRRDTSLDPRGYPDFTIYPPGDRPEYFVLTYLESTFPESRRPLGLDLAANPRTTDRRAMQEALLIHRETGTAMTSGQKIDIGQGNSTAFGMRLAVYRSRMPRDTAMQRRAAYIGSVGAGFVVPELMAGVFQRSTLRDLRFKLYEAGPADKYVAGRIVEEQRLFFDSRDLAEAQGAGGDDPSFRTIVPMEVAGRIWEIHFSAPRRALVTGIDRVLPWLALGSGLLTSLLLFMIFYSLAATARRVEEARGKAEAANIAKTKFFAAASHDLRQPMQALSMYASVLGERLTDARVLPAVRGIELSVRILEELFDSLLDISKIESGVIKPNVVTFPLMPLIERVLESEMPIAARKGLRLRVVRTSLSVRSDPALLERMLKNLMTNAIRYTERGKIVIGCRRLPGHRLRIEVADSGIGIPAQEQERIFDEYYQLAGKSSQGLGLGLPIVRSLAELLGHEVAVRSVVGHGSVFSIELDRTSVSAEPVLMRSVPPASTLSGANIVVLDDDVEIRGSMRLLLESWDCRCITGATFSEIEHQLRTQRVTPDALIVDYRLADSMDGLEAVGRLRSAFGNELPALIITGTANLSLVQRQASGIPVAMKPVSRGKLRAFLSHSVGRERASAARR